MDEIVKEFLIESREGLDRLDQDLVALEKNPSDKERLASIFRAIHTIKGSSGFLGFNKLEEVAHVGENLLSKLRDGDVIFSPDLANVLLAMIDAIRYMLDQIESTDLPGNKDFSELVGLLAKWNGESEQPDEAFPMVQSPRPLEGVPAAVSSVELAPAIPVASYTSTFTATSSLPPAAIISKESISVAPDFIVPTLDNRVPPDSESLEPKNAVRSDATVRVHVGLLDKLMNLVGELVLTRNEVLQLKKHTGDSASLSTYQRLNLITTELQENVMKTRMQPIGNVLGKLPRMVRDVAAICEKHVRLEIDGKDTELDKTIIEAIKDPLTHIVRNSIDHGIELPELRAVRRKPREGLLKIRAYHEGGQVNIEITDDGGGIDHELLKQKCLEKGLISPEQSAQMSRHEALHLIFLPGLSTTEKITNISGRGVGMDVVKTNIENIGGSVDLQSHLGSGTTIRIKIPLTLAIIPALIVTSGGDRFAIPQVSLQELLRLDGSQTADQIEFIDGVPFYRLRGQLLPLAYLNRELQLAHEFKTSLDSTSIVVLQADGRLFGLVVDSINDTEEIVVKPLSKHLKNVGVFAGATIMGDGKVALIIDVLGLALHVGIVTPLRDRSMNEKAMPAVKTVNAQHSLLIFDAGQGSRMAIPLTMVARLEEFPLSSIERSGIREVVRYRGQILPLIRVSDYVPAITDVPKETKILPVVVYTVEGRSVGLIVGRITDIIQEKIVVKRHSHGNSIFGSVVIQEKVTDLLDVQAVIRASDPEFFSSNLTMQAAA